MKNHIITIALVLGGATGVLSQTPNTNYIKSTTFKVKTSDGVINDHTNQPLSDDDKIESISYFDGLGRPLQSIQLRGGANKENIIRFHRYDAYGRESKTYLPYATNGPVPPASAFNMVDNQSIEAAQQGYYQTHYGDDFYGGVINPFSEIEFENSPLNRPFKQVAPGSDWALGSNHEVQMDYQTNNRSADQVRIFGVSFPNFTTASPSDLSNDLGKYEPQLTYEGLYASGELYKNIVKDENWTPASDHNHTVEEFTNKQGQVVLKRSYNNNQRHDTYYVYDDYGNLSFVLPPLASDQIVTQVLHLNNGSSYHLPWSSMVKVDRAFSESYNRQLAEYDNSAILNADIQNEYGGTGGLTLTHLNNSDELIVNINFSTTTALELNNGYLMDLKSFGEFKDTELGEISGPDYQYTFSIQRNQLYVRGQGEVNGINTSFSNQTQLTHSIDIPWVDITQIDKTVQNQYYQDAKTMGLSTSQMLTTSIPNSLGGSGGINIGIDPNDNITFSMNMNVNHPLELRSGALAYLDIDRRLQDREIARLTGPGYDYKIALKNNTVLIQGGGGISSIIINLTIGVPFMSYTIDTPTLQGLCYIYEYDYRNRLIEKKIPGKDWEHIVYDILDRPILTQDGNQRAGIGMEQQWLMTKYDRMGRVAYTATYLSTLSRKHLQQEYLDYYNHSDPSLPSIEQRQYEIRTKRYTWASMGNNMYYTHRSFPIDHINYEVLTVRYYDDPVINPVDGITYTYDVGIADIADGLSYLQAQKYSERPITDPKASIGLSTITEVRTLGTTQWTNSATYYDYKARPIHGVSDNKYLATLDRSWMDLDFLGKTTASTTQHAKAGVSTIPIEVENTFTYDHMDRLLTHTQQIDAQTPELIVDHTYDALGQLTSKDVGGAVGGNPLQTVDYDYNIRGWLTGINPTDSGLGNDLFSFSIAYNKPTLPGAAPLYNGNISQTRWRTASDHHQRSYTYHYDALNRITSAHYLGAPLIAQNVGPIIAGQQENYTVEDISYDKNGNVLGLYRMGLYKQDPYSFDYTAVDWVDQLSYRYAPKSNQLIDVTDTADDADAQILNGGFKDIYPGNNYIYEDRNGNMTSDLNKDIIRIDYNHLNLPILVLFNNEDRIKYTYDATGIKLEKKVTVDNVNSYTYYASNYIYEKDNNGESLQFFSHPEGYVEKDGSSFRYVYQYKDHLGNVRLNYAQGPDGLVIKEENNYYPFGLQHKGYNNVVSANANSVAQKFKYNGKELEKALGYNFYEYEARHYDAALARFVTVDPLAEKYYSFSSYAYVMNNPLRYTDPTGMSHEDIIFMNNSGDEIGRIDTGTDNHVYVSTGTDASSNNRFTASQTGEISFENSNMSEAQLVYSKYQTILYLNKYNEAVDLAFQGDAGKMKKAGVEKYDTTVSFEKLKSHLYKTYSFNWYNVSFDDDFNLSDEGQHKGIITYTGTNTLYNYTDRSMEDSQGNTVFYDDKKTWGLGQDTVTQNWYPISFKNNDRSLYGPNFIGFRKLDSKNQFIDYWNNIRSTIVNDLKKR